MEAANAADLVGTLQDHTSPSPLWLAVASNDLSLVRLHLLDAKPYEIDRQNHKEGDYTCLMMAAACG